jgi:hypothetical protein
MTVLTRRYLPGPVGDDGGLPLGAVTRLGPLYVLYQAREYGPVLATSSAMSSALAVGDQVLVALSDVDNDRLIVIDKMSADSTTATPPAYLQASGSLTVTPAANRQTVSWTLSASHGGDESIDGTDHHIVHLNQPGVYQVDVRYVKTSGATPTYTSTEFDLTLNGCDTLAHSDTAAPTLHSLADERASFRLIVTDSGSFTVTLDFEPTGGLGSFTVDVELGVARLT